MSNELEIRTLTSRFFEGETTLEEERRLYELYRSADSLPQELLPLREMMLDMESMQSCAAQKSRGERLQGWRWIALAASFLLLFTLGSLWYHQNESQDECVVYVYGERVADRDLAMQEMRSAMTALNSEDVTVAMEQQMKELFAE